MRRGILIICIIYAFVSGMTAQVKENKNHLPAFAIKTNALYWATTTPNLGFEIGLSDKFTLDLSGNYNPWTFSDSKKLKHWLVQPELRFWTCERFNGHFSDFMHIMPNTTLAASKCWD